MRPLISVLALTLLTAPVLSGCIGGDPGQDAGPTNDPGDASGNGSGNDSGNESGNESGFGGNESGNQTGNESGFGSDDDGDASEENGSAEWTYDNRTGTVSSTAPVVLSGSETEALDVENGTLELALNLTADGELDVCIKEPGAEACTEEASTSDGNFMWNQTDPTGGEWTVEFSQSDVASDVDYEIVIGQLIPAGLDTGGNLTASGNESGNDTRMP